MGSAEAKLLVVRRAMMERDGTLYAALDTGSYCDHITFNPARLLITCRIRD